MNTNKVSLYCTPGKHAGPLVHQGTTVCQVLQESGWRLIPAVLASNDRWYYHPMSCVSVPVCPRCFVCGEVWMN